MDLINSNPLRILGVLSNVSEKEIISSKTKLIRYAEIGKQIKTDVDFEFLTKLNRDVDQIQRASSAIEQNNQKLFHAMFWFIGKTVIDTTAIDSLKNNRIENAKEILAKVIVDDSVTGRNISSLLNHSTLMLLDHHVDAATKSKAIKIKTNIIESESFPILYKEIVNETYNLSSKDFLEYFLEYFIIEERLKKVNDSTIFNYFKTSSQQTKSLVSTIICETPINSIESEIENCKNTRKENKLGSFNSGIQLYNKTKIDLDFLSTIISKNDLKYKYLSDKVAIELLQCGIDYFNYYKKSSTNPCERALRLISYAKSLATNKQTVERISDNQETIEDFNESFAIKADYDKIINTIIKYKETNSSVDVAEKIFKETKSSLDNVKEVLGSYDKQYIQLCDIVMNHVLGNIIETLNIYMNSLEVSAQYQKYSIFEILKNDLAKALPIIDKLDRFNLSADKRQFFKTNKETILNISRQLGVNSYTRTTTSSSTTRTSSSSSSSSSTSRTTPTNVEENNNGCLIWGAVAFIIFFIYMCSQ